MQSLEYDLRCPECGSGLLDAEDEYVCQSCGVVREKQVLDQSRGREVRNERGTQHLGSYLGSFETTRAERQSKGFLKTNSTYKYLKLMSDYGGREDRRAYACEKLIERVGERFALPAVVILQAIAVAKKVIPVVRGGRRISVAAVAAYSIIASCKIEGNTSVSAKEIVDAFGEQGSRVKASSLIRLSLDAPVKASPRKAEEYLSLVLARLSGDRRFVRGLSSCGVSQTGYMNRLRAEASKILGALEEEVKAGHRPCALAATSIYSAEVVLAQEESRTRRLTQGDVARCGDSAEYTVREQYREIFAPVVRVITRRASQSPTPRPVV